MRIEKYSDYGAIDPAAAQNLNAIMDRVVGMLQRSSLALRARSYIPDLGLPGSTDEGSVAVRSALATIDNIIARLAGPSRAEVLAGTEAPEKWLAAANTVAQGIKDQAQLLKDSSTINLISAQMAQAADDLKKFIPQTGLGLGIGVGAVVAIVAAGALAIWLLPALFAGRAGAKSVAEYTPRKRKRRSKRRMSWFDPEQRDLEGLRS